MKKKRFKLNLKSWEIDSTKKKPPYQISFSTDSLAVQITCKGDEP